MNRSEFNANRALAATAQTRSSLRGPVRAASRAQSTRLLLPGTAGIYRPARCLPFPSPRMALTAAAVMAAAVSFISGVLK